MRVNNLDRLETIINTLNDRMVTFCKVLKPSIWRSLGSQTVCGPSKNVVFEINTVEISNKKQIFDNKVNIKINQSEITMDNCYVHCYTGGHTSCDTKIHKYLFINDTETIKVELKTT